MRKRMPQSFYNLTTMVGMVLATVTLILDLFLIVVDALNGFTHSYMGLVTYIAFPAIMLFWLFVAFVGVIRTRRRMRKAVPGKQFPTIDLNNRRHRNAVTTVGVGGLALIAFSGFGSYNAYEYTESVKFCGTTCHNVMEPEYTAHETSPHAKVSCASCHVGSGAQSFVNSKLQGTYQVYSAMFHKYHKPIGAPVRSMRAAKETCEQCHWPNQYFAQKMKTHTHFLADDKNTPYQVSLLIKVGATEEGKQEGIHAHMYMNNEISYIATDPQRQVIPYVETRGADGKVTIYRDKENPATPEALKKGERHVVDCMDCHNRPAHNFQHPDQTVNQAMSQGRIDTKLPEIKKASLEALDKPYKTVAEADAGISESIKAFYKESHPEFANSPAVDVAVKELQAIYHRSYFPLMNASWKTYPDNLDHVHNSGCFRCHDDNHVSDTGKVISRNCTTCHTIVSQGSPGAKQAVTLGGQEFKHPGDVGDAWKTTACKECHGAESK